jgi:hypothetical protein
MAEHKITYKLKGIKPPYVGGEIEINPTAVVQFYFIESIENMFLTGKIEIEDIGGLLEKLPLTGEETLEVIIEQDLKGDTEIISLKTLEFEFYNIELGITDRIKTTKYICHLVEKGFFDFVNKSYSKSYKEKHVSDIVEDICKNQLGLESDQYDVEDTSDKVNFIIPYWKPLTSLKYFTRIARRKQSPTESGYLFYSTTGDEDTENPIKKFVSFATLLEVKPDTSAEKKYYFKKNSINPNFINNFQDVKNPNFKNRKILKDGVSGKKYYGVDFVTDKTLYTVEKKYSEFVASAKMSGNVSYLSIGLDDVDSEVEFMGYPDRKLIEARQDFRFRMSLESFNKREVLVDGALNRNCGKTIYVEQATDNPDELHNVEHSGTWLIKTITHSFMIKSYDQKLVILKDAYESTEVEGHDSV